MPTESAVEDTPSTEAPAAEDVFETNTRTTEAVVEEAKLALAQFLDAHPYSSVGTIESRGKSFPAICHPWGDDSIAFKIPEDPTRLFETLNSVVLPRRFTGIWHREKRAFEIIWTAYRLPEGQEEIENRAFSFNFSGLNIDCHFSESSEELLIIAEANIPLGMSLTQFRNLQSFDVYTSLQKSKHKPPTNIQVSIGKPISFWIKGIEWNEDSVIDLIRHLNFYMTYFDSDSPTVAIHDISDTDHSHNNRVRYCIEKFPETIKSRKIDDTLLNFWQAATSGDGARRFLYYYRIIEYSAHYYLEATTKSSLKKILSAPYNHDDVSLLVERVLGTLNSGKPDDVAKFNALVRDALDVETAWREITNNKVAFSQAIEFDGGYTLAAVCGPKTDLKEWEPRGIETVSRAFRDIRNALSHGRDQKTGAVIAPTAANFKRLGPWVHLIAATAGEVMLYRDAL